MKATGKPSAEELALLEPFKASLPPEVFDEPYRPPVSDGSGKDRKLLQAADKLLNEAGWTVKNGVRVNPKGEAFDLEFLIVDPSVGARAVELCGKSANGSVLPSASAASIRHNISGG